MGGFRDVVFCVMGYFFFPIKYFLVACIYHIANICMCELNDALGRIKWFKSSACVAAR